MIITDHKLHFCIDLLQNEIQKFRNSVKRSKRYWALSRGYQMYAGLSETRVWVVIYH